MNADKKAPKVKEVKTKKEEKPYDPEFVKMVLESSKNKDSIPYDEAFKKQFFSNL